jgi:hypothetical protein
MRALLLALLVVAALLAAAPSALADHDHDLITPGTTVEDIGNGQTEKCASDPGGHQFHIHVHTGTPGTFAFGQGGQVTIVKTDNATC